MEEYLFKRVCQLAERLEIPSEAFLELRDWNYEEVLKKFGAETWCERDRVFSKPETRELSTIAPGAQIVLVSKSDSDEFFTLVQVRNNGEQEEAQKEIGFPGGACNMWKYGSRVELEHPVITAYREFYEEIGCRLEYSPIKYLTYTCTTNHYVGYPDTYAPSMYYYVKVFFEDMEKYSSGKGSTEGRIMMLPIKELKKYKWFPNAREAFEILLEMHGK